MKAGSTAMTQRSKDRVPIMLALPDPTRPDKANPSTNLWWSFFFNSTGTIYMHLIPTGLKVNKEFYVEVLREFRKIFRRKRPALFQAGQWHFQQDNAPVHNSIVVTDYLTYMGIKTVRPDLAPCDFWLFPKLSGCLYETTEEMKEAGRRSLTRSPRRTSMGAF